MTWKTLPHGPLTELSDGLWVVTGELPGTGLPRNMVVWRLPTGGLLLHSVVNLDDTELARLQSWGSPEIMIVPNGFHRMDAAAWKERFPKLQVLAPAASRKKAEEVVAVDATCEDALPQHKITVHQPDGMKPLELFYELPLSDGGTALIVTDAFFHLREHREGFVGFIFKHVTASTGHFGTTRLSRMMLVKDHDALGDWLEKLADADRVRIIVVAHGDPITTDCAAALREAAAHR